MKKLLLTLTGIMLCVSALAEMHVWNLNTGKTIEAEFIAVTGGQVSLKTIKGKTRKVPLEAFGEEDRVYIELINPPRLDVSFAKTSRQRSYPPTYNNNELPRQTIFTFIARIKQQSNQIYQHELTAEFFIIGDENAGDKNLLFHYQKEVFTLNKSGSLFELKSNEVTVTEYVSNGKLQGATFKGYMIIVTDSRGEVIATKTTKDDWLALADNLRKLPIGKTFDKNGERCWPSRPKRFY